jgi:hypothetical protein
MKRLELDSGKGGPFSKRARLSVSGHEDRPATVGCRENLLRRHAPMEAPAQPGNGDARYLGPLSNGASHSVQCDRPARPPVSRLFLGRRPSAVARLVALRVVESIDGVLRGWTATHVQEKALKGVGPIVADCDASPSVPMVRGIGRVETPALDAHPDCVLSGSARRAMARLSMSLVGRDVPGVECTTRRSTLAHINNSNSPCNTAPHAEFESRH